MTYFNNIYGVLHLAIYSSEPAFISLPKLVMSLSMVATFSINGQSHTTHLSQNHHLEITITIMCNLDSV